MDTKTVLVAGATGNVGRHLVARLHDAGVNVRALTRDPRRVVAAGLLPDGVAAVAGDLTDPASLRAAAAGADAAFLLWPFLTADGADGAVRALASRAGHIVYLSAISVQDHAPPEENGVWGQVEQAIVRSGATWTFLRAGGFAANALGWAADVRSRGVVRWVHGGAARSLIHERDIAGVAARILADGGHTGAKYVLTGPEAVTQADQARILAEATGLPVTWEEAPAEEVAELLAAFAGNRAFADHAIAYWASLVGRPEPVTGDVEKITGNAARSFRDWARDHAGEFRPRTPAEVANRYVTLLSQGNFDAALTLLAPDVIRSAPLEGPDLRGIEAIAGNARRQTAGLGIHGVAVDGPYPHGADRFAVRFTFDASPVIEKLSVYTTRDGAIVREDVYYHQRVTTS
jgi:uncharacterized protein YbjT (DUF2867 family)